MAQVPVICADVVVIVDGDNDLGTQLGGHQVTDVAAIVGVEGDQGFQPGKTVEVAILLGQIDIPRVKPA